MTVYEKKMDSKKVKFKSDGKEVLRFFKVQTITKPFSLKRLLDI